MCNSWKEEPDKAAEGLDDRLSKMADNAGKAARLDPTWNPLAAAFAAHVENTRALSPDDDRPVRDWLTTYRKIEAECRKTTP